MPPGCGSRSASRPFHSTIFSGSTKKSNTVSGRAAILISRSTTVATSGWSTATSPPSFFVLCGDLQAFEPIAPELVQKCPQVFEPFRADAVDALRPVAPLDDEPSRLENGEVLRDRRPRDRELRGDLAGGPLPTRDELQNPPAIGLGDGT